MVMELLDRRQRLMLLLSMLERFGVGFCDLLVAAAMYLLFLLLQGQPVAHHSWWTPKTGLSAAVLVLVLVVVRTLMDLVSSRSMFRLVQNLYTGFILQLTEGYSLLQWVRFVERNRSELAGHALYSTREAADFYYRCIEMASSIAIVLVMIAALIYQSPVAACGMGFALAILYGGHRFFFRKKLQEAASNRESSLRLLQRNLADMLSSGKEIRTYGNQDFFQNRVRRQAEQVAASNVRVWFLPQFSRIVSDQGALLVFLGIIIAVQLQQGDVRQLLSLLVFYFVLSRRMLPLISRILLIAGEMEGSYENVSIVSTELSECRRHRAPVLPALSPESGMAMQMNQVGFSFPGGAPILRNIDLFIRNGETIVLYGASGIGKSALLNLIAGVSQPVVGEVRVDRARIAYVPQEIPLLDDSIRNNLLFGLPAKNDEELMKALALARLDELVAAQPFGLDSAVGDNGSLFSGGERQRLGIARAFLRGGQLLLLDEATSGLDEAHEQRILENLAASGQSVLLVTHRAHARSFAHRVYRLEGGVLIDETSPGWATSRAVPVEMTDGW